MREVVAENANQNGGEITIEVHNAIGWLKFDNPDKHNALTQKMWQDLPNYIKILSDDPKARVIIMHGSGDKAFCAGADISEFGIVRKDAKTARIYEDENVAAFDAISNCQKPVIALIQGYCFGGGFGIAAAADMRIADDGAIFSVPAAKLGLAYPVAAISNIIDAIGKQATKEILFTGRRFTAAEMFDRGLLQKVCSSENLESEVMSLAMEISENAPASIRAAKLAISAQNQNDRGSQEKILELAHKIAASTFESADYKEGREAFKQLRKPKFLGE